jgi:hypothetical protein
VLDGHRAVALAAQVGCRRDATPRSGWVGRSLGSLTHGRQAARPGEARGAGQAAGPGRMDTEHVAAWDWAREQRLGGLGDQARARLCPSARLQGREMGWGARP